MSMDILNHECGYLLKFTFDLVLIPEVQHIQKGRNHHLTILIGLNSSQMSAIFIIVRSIVAEKIGDKSCQSNFDTRASDFGSFLVI